MSDAPPPCAPPRSVAEPVSVVVTTMNRFEECRRCLESVLAQDHHALDVIVVEDGSDSGIGAYIAAKGLANLRYIRQPEQRGLAAARNLGIAAATGDFIAFADDDDLWRPERVSRQIAFWLGLDQADSVAMVYCGAEIRNAAGKAIATVVPQNRGPLKPSAMAIGLRTIPSSYLFHRAALAAVGGFDEALPSSIDHDIWMALAVAGYAIDFVPDPLVVTFERIGRDTMMSRTAERIRGVSAFAAKWRDTWQDWYGDGDRHADDYFTRVIASLAADQAAQGKFGEAFRASAAALARSKRPVHCAARLGTSIARGVARGARAWLRLRLSGGGRANA